MLKWAWHDPPWRN